MTELNPVTGPYMTQEFRRFFVFSNFVTAERFIGNAG